MNAEEDAHLVERLVSSYTCMQGGFLTVVKDTVALPDGSQATREYVRHPGAVTVVPLLDDGRVVVVRQFRHPVGQVLVEFPAGKIDPGEAVHRCAVRELREETGYSAGLWARAGVFHNAAAYSTEGMEIWLARDLVPGAQALDEGEFLEVGAMSVDDLDRMAREGQLTDMKTMIGLQWLQQWQRGAWPLTWVPAPIS